MYILNRVPSKVVAKTPYELWTEKKPSIRHLHVWGCPTQARPYRLNEKKLDERTVSCYFVGYVERSQALSFIIPLLDHFLRREMQDSLRMLSLEGKITKGVLFFKKNKRSIRIKFSYLMLFFILILLLTMLKLFYQTLFKMLLWYKTTMKFFRHKTTLIKLFYSILFKMMLLHKTTMKFFLKNL